MKIPIINIDGGKTGREVDLEDSVFGIKPNKHVVYLDVKNYLLAQRQGTAKTKEKSEITASTKKLRRQKGSGAARVGSAKSPIFKGGGTIFGPKPRDYRFKLNKKIKKLAKKSVLSSRMNENNIRVLEDFNFEQPKTKDFVKVLDNLAIKGKKSLFLVNAESKNLLLSSRNIQKTQVITIDQLNTYDLINSEYIILCESIIDQLNERLN